MPTLNEILQSDQRNTEQVVSAFKKALKDESFVGLNLHGNFNPTALINLFTALKDNKAIIKLHIDKFPLTDEALSAFIVTLKKNHSL